MSTPDVSDTTTSGGLGFNEPVSILAAICLTALVILILGLFCWLVIRFSRWRLGRNRANEGVADERRDGDAQRSAPIASVPPYLQNVAPGNRFRTFLEWSKTCLDFSGVRLHLPSVFYASFDPYTTQNTTNDIEAGRGGGVSRARLSGQVAGHSANQAAADAMPMSPVAITPSAGPQFPVAHTPEIV